MKKLLLIPLIAFVLCSFGQTIPRDSRLVKNGCSFTTKDAADVAAHHTFINADESISDIVISKNANGTYCSWTVVVCDPGLTLKPFDVKTLDLGGVDVVSLEVIHYPPAKPSPAPVPDTVTAPSSFKYFDPRDNRGITKFLTEQAKEFRKLGWKYTHIEFVHMDNSEYVYLRDKLYVTITANNVDEYWNECKTAVYTPANLVPYNLTAITDFYYNMGYICVCGNNYVNTGLEGGQWPYWQQCAWASASMQYDCPCDIGLNKKNE